MKLVKRIKIWRTLFLTLTNGIKLELVYRSATAKGIERFISSKEYKDRFEEYDVVYIGSNDSDDENQFEKYIMIYFWSILMKKQLFMF